MIKPYYDREQLDKCSPGDVNIVLAEHSPTVCLPLSSALQVPDPSLLAFGAETVPEGCESLSGPEIGRDIESPSVATV